MTARATYTSRSIASPPFVQPSMPSSSVASSSARPADIASLRAAALSTKRSGSNSPAPSSLRQVSPIPPSERNGSISTALAKVELAEKEEGEISEDEEDTQVVEPTLPVHQRDIGRPVAYQRRRSPPPRQRSQIPARRHSQASSGGSASPVRPRVEDLKSDVKGKGKERQPLRNSPGPVASAPVDISPSEARQYMDIIRNLLHEGFSPETLIKRGATAKYVKAVCEDIVEGTKRRKALWLEPREPVVAEATPVPVSPVPEERSREESSSPEVEVAVSIGMGRRSASLSSEGSAEIKLLEHLSPPRAPRKLESWAPPPPPVAPPPRHSAPPPPLAVRIETYKPQQPFQAAASSSSSSSSRNASLAIPTEPASHRSSVPLLARIGPAPSSAPTVSTSAPSRSRPIRPMADRSQNPRRPLDERLTVDKPVVLNYDDEDEQPPPPSQRGVSPPSFAPMSTAPPLPPALPVTTATTASPTAPVTSSLASTELAAKNAILEARRKVLASMKLRRGVPARPDGVAPSSSTLGQATPDVDGSATMQKTLSNELQRSIEQEVADLEQEMTSLQQQQPVSMPASPKDGPSQLIEVDASSEPEEGEIIISSTLPAPTPVATSTPPLFAASLPTARPNSRGIKRPNAEDLESRPTTSLVRPVHPTKRRLFGGKQKRPIQLVINLDEDDETSSSSEEEDQLAESSASGIVTPMLPPGMDVVEHQRILAEKEESIRRLKEQIAERMRVKLLNKGKGKSRGGSETPKMEMVEEAVAEVMGHQPAASIPIPDPRAAKANEQESPEANEPMVIDATQHPTGHLPADNHSNVPDHFTPTNELPPPPDNIGPSSPAFHVYQPLLRRYPHLPTPSLLASTLPHLPAPAALSPRKPVSALPGVDMPRLTNIVLTSRLERDPQAVLCAAEVGGGVCADAKCASIHLSRGMKPTYEDLVEYLLQVAPPSTDRDAIERILNATSQTEAMPSPIKAKGKKKDKGKKGRQTWTIGDPGLTQLLESVEKTLRGGS